MRSRFYYRCSNSVAADKRGEYSKAGQALNRCTPDEIYSAIMEFKAQIISKKSLFYYCRIFLAFVLLFTYSSTIAEE